MFRKMTNMHVIYHSSSLSPSSSYPHTYPTPTPTLPPHLPPPYFNTNSR